MLPSGALFDGNFVISTDFRLKNLFLKALSEKVMIEEKGEKQDDHLVGLETIEV